MDRFILCLLISVVALTQISCTGLRPVVRQSGEDADSQTRDWQAEILRLGQDGDWLVIRGYQGADDLVAAVGNAEFSHVGILDARDVKVVEAARPKVRKVALRAFLERSNRVQLIRPTGADQDAGRAALERARGKIGASYDFLGTVGAPSDQRFYCSELAAWSAGIEVNLRGPRHVLHPASMSKLGTVLFDSESRAKAATKQL